METLFTSAWQSPSNIALVKYWGKYGNQMPANPSISFTLQECHTDTKVTVTAKTTDEDFAFRVLLDGKESTGFREKIHTFFRKIAADLPFLQQYHISIATHNSFPHSSGIASSASGMSALALCLAEIAEKMGTENAEDLIKKASRLARIGSGSACRSLYGGLVVWGEHPEIAGSSQEFGIPFPGEVHPVFYHFCDTVLLVHEGQKTVSSSIGHGLMKGHPYANQRFADAQKNLSRLLPVLASGNLDTFIEIVELEALTLHAMMMTSTPYFILMKPGTLQIIEKIWEYRRQSGVPVFFTLDAGANVHVLYPAANKVAVETFIAQELSLFCENKKYICDTVGNGPQRLEI